MAAAERDDRWVSLNEAADAAGVTIATLTGWYRGDEIASRLERGPHGERRIVFLAEVLARASRGTEVLARAHGASEPELRAVAPAGDGGGVLVPLEAWQQALEQLSHLHETARELAEAKAQAAKHETTSEFLRERVRELKDELEQARAPKRRRFFFRSS